ncbi:RNA-binding cell elongation regulator Jag/EloR [Levilactobacillus acidifarinae]|uniref:RNA-binding protein KhpB n=1 Tax=Levilactobacillus acidifarinae DSM 19394 = JCM 15949 TaxID=1423715 RepID=A0A0R1LIZ2_9LACO|nr:RNA-binding cell elongation regulator Jag/EloR [Levilactobacillus acidifarinae]KRK95862.1 RNA-binding protein [Levilactobacillus acidifarinae DSM 19394]GEO69160.1 single-stranded DNA-binding protein [Levilactobacillus acidifarinae]
MTIFTGKTEAAAITAGLDALNATREQVTVQVVTAARKGWLGIGHREAQVDVQLKVPTSTTQSTSATPQPQASEEAQGTSVASAAPRVAAKPAPTVTQSAQPAQSAQNGAQRQAAIAAVADYVTTIVDQLGIQATVDVQQPARRQVRLELATDKEGLLIGKHGRTINALQSLAQLFLNHHGAAHVVVELDVADYRERRRTTLARLAENTAREVVASGKPIYLDPMPSFERKQIHAALAKNRHVTTYSAGKEPHRAVVIEPA